MRNRLFTLLLMLTMCVSYAMADLLDVMVYIQEEGSKDRVPAAGYTVYTFLTKRDAERALKFWKDAEYNSISAKNGLLDKRDFSGMLLQMNGSFTGWVMVDDNLTEPVLLDCSKLLEIDADGNKTLAIVIKKAAKKTKNGKEKLDLDAKGEVKEKTLDDTEVKGSRSMRAAKRGVGNACGNKCEFDKDIYLDNRDLMRTDARYVVSPILLQKNGENWDTVAFMKPVVLDGDEYHRTMHRRMGYKKAKAGKNEYDREKNDKLHPYVEQYHYMQTRQPDSVHVSGAYYGYSDKNVYKVMGHAWFEDYNTVYNEEYITLWDGKVRRPQRYLDWSGVMRDQEIKSERYIREERKEATPGNFTMHLEFEVGKSTLNMADSTTYADLHKAYDELGRIYRNPDAELTKVVIRGYSSPEGGFETNKRLSHERSAHVAGLLKNNVGTGFPLTAEFDKNDNIVPWTYIADTLDVIGTDSAKICAEQIREVCAKYSTIDAQSKAMPGIGMYRTDLLRGVLKDVRRVIIDYASIEQRVVPDEETYARYLNGEVGYADGKYLKGYQYYGLMRRLNQQHDWDGLERIARAAYQSTSNDVRDGYSVREQRGPALLDEKGDTVRDAQGNVLFSVLRGKPQSRPYPLAAFYLTKCMIRNRQADTKLLLPYIDDSNAGLENQRRGTDGRYSGEWWNDEAIVLNQVMMYCLNDDFQRAYITAVNHLPDNENFHSLRMMLRAMNCEFTDPEVFEAVSKTTPMNACAMYIAQNDKKYFQKADSLLKDTTLFSKKDSRVPYLKAICRFNLECPTSTSENISFYNSLNVHDPNAETGFSQDWAAPMIEAMMMDPENVDLVKSDGFFNEAYRGMVQYFYKRLKEGVALEDVCKEYDTLVQKYR